MAAPLRPDAPDPASGMVQMTLAQFLEWESRQDDGTWTHVEASDATGISEFAPPCVDAVLTLNAVYADTDIAPPPPDLLDPAAFSDPAPAPTDAPPPS